MFQKTLFSICECREYHRFFVKCFLRCTCDLNYWAWYCFAISEYLVVNFSTIANSLISSNLIDLLLLVASASTISNSWYFFRYNGRAAPAVKSTYPQDVSQIHCSYLIHFIDRLSLSTSTYQERCPARPFHIRCFPSRVDLCSSTLAYHGLLSFRRVLSSLMPLA